MMFGEIYFSALLVILLLMTTLWVVSVVVKNVSIVDMFWGFGFVLASSYYFYATEGFEVRKLLVMTMVAIWGIRLSVYLAWRNYGKGEDFRYQEFRRKYGEKRYWWLSFFQTFLLQGVLMWLISVPLLGAQFNSNDSSLNVFDFLGIFFWVVGFVFESGGDFQLARFKANPLNKGKVLNTGFWKYTRHPNYFGDSAVWWGFGFLSLASGSYLPIIGSVLMTLLIIKVSGVALLEKTLKTQKTEYAEYIRKTSVFIPWFPKR